LLLGALRLADFDTTARFRRTTFLPEADLARTRASPLEFLFFFAAGFFLAISRPSILARFTTRTRHIIMFHNSIAQTAAALDD
jgi:hypothetical protein